MRLAPYGRSADRPARAKLDADRQGDPYRHKEFGCDTRCSFATSAMTTPEPGEAQRPGTHSQVLPLYAAGFVTAFGAHSIAASLGGYIHGQHASLLALGLLLAVYDGAEVALKPVFGSLADRIGPRPVLLAGLLAFAITSGAFVVAGDPAWVGLARFGQGAAAAAFSPAAGVLVSRLNPPSGQGRGFGRYGAWKGLGYTLGPMLGGGLIAAGGYNLLFATLAAARGSGRGMGAAGGSRRGAVTADPSNRRRPGPSTHQPRVHAAHSRIGRCRRSPVGRSGVSPRRWRRARPRPTDYRRDRLAARGGRRPDSAPRGTRLRQRSRRRPRRSCHRPGAGRRWVRGGAHTGHRRTGHRSDADRPRRGADHPDRIRLCGGYRPRKNDSARRWVPPKSVANSATPVAHWS